MNTVMALTPAELLELRNYICETLTVCDCTHKLTTQWLADRGLEFTDEIKALIADLGACCRDCEVEWNFPPTEALIAQRLGSRQRKPPEETAMTKLSQRKTKLSFTTSAEVRYRGRLRDVVVEVESPFTAAVRLAGTRLRYPFSWRGLLDWAAELYARQERERRKQERAKRARRAAA